MQQRMSKSHRMLRRLPQALLQAVRRIPRDEVVIRASSLAFSSLFALVPVAAISLSIVANFASFHDEVADMKKLVIKTFLPGVGEALESHIDQFIANAGALSAAALVALLISCALLIHEIHATFNRLFGSFGNSSLREQLLEFWALLTALPFAVLSIVSMSSSFLKEFGIAELVAPWQSSLMPWAAFFIVLVMFTPKKTPLSAILIGATLGCLIYGIAQYVFIRYITMPIIPNLLYGALAVVPLLQLWLLIVWTIVIFTATVTAELVREH